MGTEISGVKSDVKQAASNANAKIADVSTDVRDREDAGRPPPRRNCEKTIAELKIGAGATWACRAA